MSDKLEKRIEKNKSIAERGITDAVASAQESQQQQNAWMTMGGIMVVNHIAQALNAQTIRGIQRIRDEELYKPLGFNRFDDFLDECNESPMTYKKFNEQEKLLMREGDALFDVLSAAKISMRQRRLLGAGNVRIDENTVIIKSPTQDGESETVDINDRARLLQILSAVADQAAALNASNQRQKQQIERGEREIENLHKKVDAGTGGKIQLAHFEIWMRSITPLNQLIDYVKKDLSPEEKERDGETYLRSFAVSLTLLADAYKVKNFIVGFDEEPEPRQPLAGKEENELHNHVGKKMKNFKGDDEISKLTADLNEDDLAALMD